MDVVATFVTFFAVIDPIGTVPVFLAVTPQYDAKIKRRIAIRAFVVASAVLLFFLTLGELILDAMDIPLSAFQVSGGVVLFIFALTMIFGESKPEVETRLADDDHQNTAVFPLAVPSLASPGAMLAVVLATQKARFTIWQQTQTGIVVIAVLLIALGLMLLASWIDRVIGKAGASVISRVMGLILTAVAAKNILAGLQSYFG
ncbi:MAG: MarC family protein [Myxococcota bacterium]